MGVDSGGLGVWGLGGWRFWVGMEFVVGRLTSVGSRRRKMREVRGAVVGRRVKGMGMGGKR